MRKLILLFSLLAISFCSYSQTVNLGVLGGANVSTFSIAGFTEYRQSHLITGYNAGLFAEIWFNQFSVEPIVQYSTVNTNEYDVDTRSGGDGTDQYRLHYLQIPVNLFYNIPVSFGKIFIGGGPYWGFGLSGNIYSKNIVDENYDGFPLDYTTKYKFNNPDHGLDLAAGIRFKNGIRFSLGYSRGYKSDPGILIFGDEVKINSFNSSIGFAFL